MSLTLANNLQRGLSDYLPLVRLTRREIDVIQRVLTGKSAKQIARELDLSYRTVEQHIANIKFKFGCRTKFELALKFYPINVSGINV